MSNIFTKLFSKPEKEEKIPSDGFKTSLEEPIFIRENSKKDIIVKTDAAFRTAPSKIIEEIKSKFQKPDYSNLEFDEDIEDFNLKAVSPEAKKLIIQIIKEDNKKRENKITTYTDSKTISVKFPPTDLSKQPQQYGIYPDTKQVDIIDEFNKDKILTFTEYGKILEKEQGDKNLENKEELLYKLVSTYFPGNTHEENIEFIKQNLKLDEVKS